MEKYEDKFASLIEACKNLQHGDTLYIATPHALGDNYEELIESLNRIAGREILLAIVPRKDRESPGPRYKSN